MRSLPIVFGFLLAFTSFATVHSADLMEKNPGHHSKKDAPAELEWEPDIYPESQIFPSFIIGTAAVRLPEETFPSWGDNHLGDPQGIIGIQANGLRKGSKVEITIKGNDLMRASKLTGSVPKQSDTFAAHPKISWNYRALARVKQAEPIDITMELSVDGKSLGEKTVTATLRSVNDCLFGVSEDSDSEDYSDYSWLFASYVNEDHPWVDDILKEALQTGLVSSFDSYQSGEKEAVLQQIYAIWTVMQQKGMRYSNTTTTSFESETVYCQHVRLFDESVRATQANCVDGSVLIAAVLRKIGLDPKLALIPGHMFLVVSLDDETSIGLETTMMGETEGEIPDSKQLKSALGFVPNHRDKSASWSTFLGAVQVGTKEYRKARKKFDSDDAPDYQLIDLAEARSLGILPITSALK